MLEEQVVSFKVAKLAWEKGFRDTTGKWRGKSYYNYKGELNGDVIDQLRPANRNNPKFDSVAAPHQSLLQTWLRDKHDIVVYVDYKSHHVCRFHIISNDNEIIGYNGIVYEKVLEKGLFEALNIIQQ